MQRISLLGLLLAAAWGAGLAGCGQPKEAEDPHVVQSAGLPAAAAASPVLESVETPLTQLERVDVVRVVDAGLGSFLGELELAASVSGEKFEGFRIVRFKSPSKWRGVGLLPGDVVQSINDQPIERPEQAHAVFASLRSAPALEVSYLRGGRPMRLSLPIVGPALGPAGERPQNSGSPGQPASGAPASK